MAISTLCFCGNPIPKARYGWDLCRKGCPKGKALRHAAYSDPNMPEVPSDARKFTGDEKDRYRSANNYICAICENAGSSIDHSHDCCPSGKYCPKCVRGLLCTKCNQGLGFYNDSPTLLRRAADYIEQWEKNSKSVTVLNMEIIGREYQ